MNYGETFIHDRAENPPESVDQPKESINKLPDRFYYCAVESLDAWPGGKPKCKAWASVDRSRVCTLTTQ